MTQQTITFAFYKGRLSQNPHALLFDRLVTSWPRTKGDFSHGEVVAPSGYEGWSSSLRDKGVRKKAINFNSGRWVRVTVPVESLGVTMAMIEQWYANHARAPFDTLGILGFVVPFRLSYSQWYFCTESIACALGLDNPHTWHPNKLYAYLISLKGAVSDR